MLTQLHFCLVYPLIKSFLTRNSVNRTLRRHSDTVFYPMAIRAVAHQIDQLYLESTAPSSSEDAPDFDVGQLDDLSREK